MKEVFNAGLTMPWVEALRSGRPAKILTYGTSLTAGGAWVEQLSAHLNAQFGDAASILNVGAGSMWSQWGDPPRLSH